MSQIFPIEADSRFRILTASAGQTVFAIAFPFQSNADIKALERSGDEWVEIAGGYTITGAGNPSGGTLTFAVGRTEDEDILILGSAVLERLTSIVLNGRFSSKATDDELDRNRLIQQEVTREVDRAVKTSYGEEAPTLDLGIPDGSVLIKQGLRLTAGPTGAAINSAETFAQQAIAAAGTASSAAGLAVGAAETSVDARDLAQKWASNPEDSVVAGGLYSAFHWAKKAAQVVLDGLVDLSVTTAKIANGAVTQAKLASSFVSGWSSKGTLADADTFLIGDSAASGVAKVSTLANTISSIFNGTRAIANGVFLAASFAWQNAGGFKRTHNVAGHTADRATNWPNRDIDFETLGVTQSSGQLTVTAGGLLQFTHTLGAPPKKVSVDLVCVGAELGWAVGDVIKDVGYNPFMAGSTASNTNGPTRYIDPAANPNTVVNVRWGSQATTILTWANKTTGAAANLTYANWRAVINVSL